jgi:hypothetical protein
MPSGVWRTLKRGKVGFQTAVIGYTAGLQIESGQASKGHRRYPHAKAEAQAKLLLDGRSDRLWFTCYDLEADFQLVEFATPKYIECEFSCLGEAAHNIFDRSWKDIYPSHDQRIVDAADHAPFQAAKTATARATPVSQLDPVACSVSDDRHSDPPQIGDDELALLSLATSLGVDDLEYELALIEM